MTQLVPRETFKQIRQERVEEILSLRAGGQKVVGYFCIFSPVEVIAGAGAIPVRLMGGGHESQEKGEEFLRADACSYCSASLGRFEHDPLCRHLDAVVSVNTCDMMRRLPEAIEKYFRVPTFQLHMARTSEPLPHRLGEFRGQLEQLARELGALTGVAVTDERLASEIESYNRLRGMLRQTSDTRKTDSPVLGGGTMLDLTATAWLLGPVKAASLIEELLRMVNARPRQEQGRPRLMLGGSMLAEDDRWLVDMIEERADIVADTLCTGTRWFAEDVGEDGGSLKRLTRFYFGRDCMHRRPNTAYYQYARRVAADFRVHGFIYKTLLYCDPYSFEAKRLQQALNLPMLHLDTDYSTENREQVRTRVEAFMEIL